MRFQKSFLLINNVKLSVNASHTEAFSVARGILKKAGLASFAKEYRIFRRSIDARHKPDIYFVYSVAVSGDFPYISEEKQRRYGISQQNKQKMPTAVIGDTPLSAPPVIVGSGPCGLFAALLLAEEGYNPIDLINFISLIPKRIFSSAREAREPFRTVSLSPGLTIP